MVEFKSKELSAVASFFGRDEDVALNGFEESNTEREELVENRSHSLSHSWKRNFGVGALNNDVQQVKPAKDFSQQTRKKLHIGRGSKRGRRWEFDEDDEASQGVDHDEHSDEGNGGRTSIVRKINGRKKVREQNDRRDKKESKGKNAFAVQETAASLHIADAACDVTGQNKPSPSSLKMIREGNAFAARDTGAPVVKVDGGVTAVESGSICTPFENSGGDTALLEHSPVSNTERDNEGCKIFDCLLSDEIPSKRSFDSRISIGGKPKNSLRPKTRSKQKNIRKDNRRAMDKPSHLILGRPSYNGRPLTRETRAFLGLPDRSSRNFYNNNLLKHGMESEANKSEDIENAIEGHRKNANQSNDAASDVAATPNFRIKKKKPKIKGKRIRYKNIA